MKTGWLFEHLECRKYIRHTDCVFKGLFDTDIGSYGLSFITKAFSDGVLLRAAHGAKAHQTPKDRIEGCSAPGQKAKKI